MEERTLDSQVAIVTGAGSKGNRLGVGKATALLLARGGASVVLVDRHEDRANDTRREIEDAGGKASVVIVDLAGALDCDRVVEEAVAALGRVDILVSNAAAFAPGTILDTTPEQFERIVAVNLTVPFMLTKAALPVMLQGGGGCIVYISTIVAMRGPGPPAYAASKAALDGLTVSLANTYGTQGVRVNCVVPGMVDTPMRAATVAQSGLDEQTLNVGKATATGKMGDAWDIAHMVAFLASPLARHITGLILPVDGGATTRLP